MSESENAVLAKELAEATAEVRGLKQTLHGPEGYPDGLIGQIKEIKKELQAQRIEAREETNDLRRAIRNFGFTVAGSVIVAVVIQYVLS